MRNNRFLNIVSNRWALPISIMLSVLFWVLTAFAHKAITTPLILGNYTIQQTPIMQIGAMLLYAFMGYFLILMNNTFSLIRMRASMQTSIYFLLIAVIPQIHAIYSGNIAGLMCLFGLYFLFSSYQQQVPFKLFYAFLFLGLASVLNGIFLLLIPFFFLGAYMFRSFHLKGMFASILGVILPLWLLWSHAYWYNEMNQFYAPFQHLVVFKDYLFDGYVMAETTTMIYLMLLYIASSIHYFLTSYEDKIQTRSYVNYIILLCLPLFIGYILYPQLFSTIVPLLIICISFLFGHYCVLTRSRTANIFSCISFLLLIMILIFNIWKNL